MVEMTESLPIIEVGVIAITAMVFGVVFAKLRLSSALGFIIAGLALGPLGMRFLVPNSGLSPVFGEFGVFMLMFYLGLELNIRKFSENGAASTVLALLQMSLTFAAGFIVAKLIGFSDVEAIIVSTMLVATSTAIVSKFMLDNNLIASLEGKFSLSILIFQDFFAIFMLVLLTSLSTQRSFNVVVLNALFFMIGTFFIVNRVSRYVLGFLHSIGHANKVLLYAIGMGVITASFGVLLGLSASLGAYFAGLALAETTYGEKIKREVGFYREFFILFFFVSFGATLFYNPVTHVAAIPPLAELVPLALIAALFVIVHVAALALSIGFGGALTGIKKDTAASITLLLIPLGEFVVILAAAAQPLLPANSFLKLSALSFLLILLTGPLTPLLYGNKKLAEKIFAVFLKPFDNALSSAGRKALAAEKNLVAATDTNRVAFTLKNMAKNLVIALAIVYLAVFARARFSDSAVPFLPLDLSFYAIILLLVVYPLFRFMIEFRSLVEQAASTAIIAALPKHRGKTLLLEEEIASAVTSLLLVAAGFAATIAVYYALPDQRVYLVLPAAYSVLALLQLSRAIYNIVEHFDVIEAMESPEGRKFEGNDAVYALSRDFDERSQRFRVLHLERETTREKIKEAMRQGDVKLVRTLLTQLKKKEQFLLSNIIKKSKSKQLSKIIKNKDTRQAFEEYLLRKAAEINFDR